jgi:FAD/FMN-containing dehydrogenase
MAETTSARMQTLDAQDIAGLAASLRGRVLGPGDDGFPEACALWNGMVTRRPRLVVKPTGAADVSATVKFARAHGLPLSVRGGGHNVAGNALCDGGVAIDLSGMRGVRVDPVRRIARAEGGATLGDVDHEAQAHALATPLGVVSRTGVGGLTLHGGLGFLTRHFGLSCDNLIGADVVTADGRLVTADRDHHSDLLWALRGGGGNFGVVTSLEYQLHPVGPEVWMFIVMYPMDEAQAVFRFFREYMPTAPDDLMAVAILWNSPHDESIPEAARNQPVAILAGAHSGPFAEGERAIAPFRQVATPLVDFSGPMPFVAAQRLFDADFPNGRRYYWKSLYLDSLDDTAVAMLVDRARARPSKLSSVDIWALGGAMRREPAGGSAFSHRDRPFLLGIEANWDDASDDARNVEWARGHFADMGRFSRGGMYLNFPGLAEEGDALLRQSFGSSYERLQAVKAKYDPENVFRSTFNIEPATGSS